MNVPSTLIRRWFLALAALCGMVQLTAAQAPSVATGTAIWETSATATLTGTVNPNGFATTAQFEYGETTAYGSTIFVTVSPVDGTEALSVSVNLGTLPADTTYHYRLTASNASGTTTGDDHIFITERVSGDYKYTTADDTATITGYTGAGGAVAIPDTINGLTVTGIGHRAFINKTTLTSVTIPTGVTRIGAWAFYSCTGLTSVSIPAGVTSIGDYAFSYCPGLTAITVDNSNSIYSSLDGVLFDKAHTLLIQYPGGKAGAYSIPASVTSIWDWAFKSCAGLTAITVDNSNSTYSSLDGVLFDKAHTLLIRYPGGKGGAYSIPASVTSIGDEAFYNCYRLSSVTLPASVTSIGGIAFAYCRDLTSIVIPEGVTSIGDWAFADCDGLTNITLPTSVTSIGKGVFAGCIELIGIALPSGITTIGDDMFAGCSGLTSIIIPPHVTSIGSWAFEDCSGLTSINLPTSVTSIGDYAFNYCPGLTSVTLPASVTSIGNYAFKDCSGLTSAVFLGDAPTLDWAVFESAAPGFTIRYLSGSSGFTTPTWTLEETSEEYPTEVIDESTYPAAPWLLTHGLDYDTNLSEDLNGDGVSLLMAYALNLDPNINLQSSMPVAVLEPGVMSLTFHAASPGITYTVETSTDLQTWVTDGVFLSELAPDNTRTATVDRTSPRRFLRLAVTD